MKDMKKTLDNERFFAKKILHQTVSYVFVIRY